MFSGGVIAYIEMILLFTTILSISLLISIMHSLYMIQRLTRVINDIMVQ